MSITDYIKRRDKNGDPLIFEELIADFIAQGLRPDQAVRAATTRRPDLQREYHQRLLSATRERSA
jgi:hypothetical protein